MVWYSHLFQNFPQIIVIHTVQGFGIVNKAEIDFFLELSCFFHDPADVGNLISCSSAFPKTSLNILKFTFHILLKPGLENFEHYMKPIRLINFVLSSVAQSCLTLCDPRDGSPPVPVILQARTLEWVAISFSRGSFQPRDQTQVSHIAGSCFTI